MYARGMSQRDIAATIEDIYVFQLSHEQISNITDCVMEEMNRWRTRPLKPFYPFSFVDCIYVSMRTERGIRQVAVYVMLAYDNNGYKNVLGLWINETESKHAWMQIFDELKARGIEALGILVFCQENSPNFTFRIPLNHRREFLVFSGIVCD